MIAPHIDVQYKQLLQNIIDNGYKHQPAQRQDVGTTQIDVAQLKIDLRRGFPLLTTKKLPFKLIVTELLFFLSGNTNIKYLIDRGCNIWNADAYKYYLRLIKKHVPEIADIQIQSFNEFLDKVRVQKVSDYIPNYIYGDLGPIYSKQWRRRISKTDEQVWDVIIDQIANLIKDIKHAVATGYNNRRLIVDAWNPAETNDMALPPCHKGFQVILEPISLNERIKLGGIPESLSDTAATLMLDNQGVTKYYLNLVWEQRSVDTFLGLPWNIASYAILTHILGAFTNTIPKMLYGDLRCVHIYDNHIEQVKEQLKREEYSLPKLVIANNINLNEGIDEFIQSYLPGDIQVERYEAHPAIKADMVS